MAPDVWLVLGAGGSFGGAVALEFVGRGRKARALVRNRARAADRLQRAADIRNSGTSERPGQTAALDAIEFVEGDVQDLDALRAAAEGCGGIVHGVNYPYAMWVPHMEAATRNVIEAAQGRPIVFPGNVYIYGRRTGGPIVEFDPPQPNSRKGAVRVELETMLEHAAAEGRARVLIVRAGDYFGPTVRNGLVDPIFGAAAKGSTIRTIGRLDIPHEWAFVPDLARAAVDLAEAPAEPLAPFETVHFPGYVARPQRDFLKLVARESGHPNLGVGALPWSLVRLAGLFDATIRELMEMRYLWDDAVILGSRRFPQLLPGFRHTPIEAAARETIESYRTRENRTRENGRAV